MADEDPRSTPPGEFESPYTHFRIQRGKNGELDPLVRKDLAHISESLSRLDGAFYESLGEWLSPGLSLSRPDMGRDLLLWAHAILEGRLPNGLSELTLEAQSKVADRLQYWGLAALMAEDLKAGLRLVAEAVQLAPDIDELRVAADLLSEDEYSELEARLVRESHQALARFTPTLLHLLSALKIAVGLLAGVSPEDLLRGRRHLLQARAAGGTPKYARGIQAAVDRVYVPGMPEQECWERLADCHGEEIEAGGIGFRLRRDGERSFYEVNLSTERERGIQRESFFPYFRRAKQRTSKEFSSQGSP